MWVGDESTARCCSALVSAAPLMLKTAPTMPAAHLVLDLLLAGRIAGPGQLLQLAELLLQRQTGP